MTFRAIFMLCALAIPVSGQEAATKIPVSIYAFGYASGYKTVQVRTGADSYQDLRLSTANIVGPVKALLSEGRVTLHGEPKGEGDAAKGVRPLLAKARVPKGLKKALVVLVPADKGAKLPYRCLVFEHSRSGFPLGVYRLINFSPYPIRGAVGSSVITAKPSGTADLVLKGDPGTVLPVRFEYFVDKQWTRLTETRCAVRRDRRWLMCLYQDPRTKRLNIRSIPDRSAPSKKAE